MSIYIKFSKELYRARQRAGFTQAEVAEAVGVSKRWYQCVERGDRLPGALVLLRLILLLHLDVEAFREEAGLIALHTA